MTKTFYITAAAMMLTVTALSQSPTPPNQGYKKKEFKFPSFDRPIVLNDSALKRNQQLMDAFLRSRLTQVQGRHSHETLNGDIYLLAPSNMPCLVPDEQRTASMPNGAASKTMPENMPNAYPKRKIIPGKQK